MAAPAPHPADIHAIPPDSGPALALGAPGATASWAAKPPRRRGCLPQDPQPLRSRRRLPSRHAESISPRDTRSCGDHQPALGRDDTRGPFVSRATAARSADYRMVTDLADEGRGILGGHA